MPSDGIPVPFAGVDGRDKPGHDVNPPLVAFRDVEKTFPNGVRALRGVTFAVRAGTCHAICGENGAGKSTLMKCLFGLEAPDSGSILIDGRAVGPDHSPRAAAAAGIGMVHQHLLCRLADRRRERRAGARADARAADRPRRGARGGGPPRHATRFRLSVDPDARVANLSVAAQQKVEILKALARDVRLLILDEPTAVLTPQETAELFERLRHLRAEGLTIIFISHKLREVRELAEHVTVLREGRVVGDAPIDAVSDDAIARLVMGREVRAVRRAVRHTLGAEVLRVAGLSMPAAAAADRLEDVSFVLHAGEILGVAGVEGNGQRGGWCRCSAGSCGRRAGRRRCWAATCGAWTRRRCGARAWAICRRTVSRRAARARSRSPTTRSAVNTARAHWDAGRSCRGCGWSGARRRWFPPTTYAAAARACCWLALGRQCAKTDRGARVRGRAEAADRRRADARHRHPRRGLHPRADHRPRRARQRGAADQRRP